MKKIAQCISTVSMTMLFSLAQAGLRGTANAGPNVPTGQYCLTYDVGGSDCSFTSYSQCLATASGIDAECYGKIVRDDGQHQGDGSYASANASVRFPHKRHRARRSE